jgi:hypothetical protein
MEESLALRLLDEIAGKGLCKWVNLSLMGEPLLHPGLLSIAEHGVRLGLPIHLITNLSLLDSELVRRLLELPIAHLALSLQTPTEEDFELKRAPGHFSFDQCMETLDRTVRTKLETESPTEITIHLLTTRLERPRGKALLERTRERLNHAHRFRVQARSWARDFSLSPPTPPPVLEPLHFWLGLDAFVPLLPGVALSFKRATLWANTLLVEDTRVVPLEKGSCQLALDTLGVLWDGSLTQCCLDFDGVLSFGSVAEQSIREVLESDAYSNHRRDFAQGRLTRPFCQRCRGRVAGPSARRVVPGSVPALIGEGWKYLGRFQFERTLRRIPQELYRYLSR